MIAVSDIVSAMLALGIGIPFGYWLRRPRGKADPNGCTCGHPRGFHRGGTGGCRHDIPTNWFTLMVEGGEHNTCGCQVYDGPQRPEDIIRGFQP